MNEDLKKEEQEWTNYDKKKDVVRTYFEEPKGNVEKSVKRIESNHKERIQKLIHDGKNIQKKNTIRKKKKQVVMAYTVGVAASLAAFWAVPSSMAALQWACVFAIGFFLYGPQMLIGLCGAELVGPESVGASEGFLGWVAYLGAANAGVPLSLIVKNYGWGAYFSALLCACAGALLLLAPMVGLRSHVQREADEEKKLA